MTEDDKPSDEQIQELLGGLGAVGPIPSDVSDRIGAALDDLPAPAPVRSARPHVGRWLATAAAIVVVGGGGTYLVQHLHESTPAATSSADSAAGTSASPCSSCSTKKHPPATDQGLAATNGRLDSLAGRVALPKVRSTHFAHDVRALLDPHLDYAAQQPTPQRSAAKALADCALPAGAKRADVTEIALDGRLAQLVVTGSGEGRVALAYDCAGTTVLDSVALAR